MCGIVAAITADCYTKLLQCLYQIQNRGYDSAGICTLVDNQFIIDKFASTDNVSALDKLNQKKSLHDGHMIGIAHTRWATHGGKTDINSHPHLSSDGVISVVHNGIIENYQELKDFLISKGYQFKSETDTEVISNLLAYYYKEYSSVDDEIYNEYDYTAFMEKAIATTIQIMQGTWGLAILNKYTPNRIYCTRVGSPLLVGKNVTNVFVTSEQSGFNNEISSFIILDNRDICTISHNGFEINIKTHHKYSTYNVSGLQKVLSPKPYPHWTIKEIYEQVNSIEAAFNHGGRLLDYTSKLGGLDKSDFDFNLLDQLNIIGCGSSLNSGEIGKYYFKYLKCFGNVSCIDSSELLEHDFNYKSKNMLIVISQSGETIDTIVAMNKFKKLCNYIFSIVNVVGSSISELSDSGSYLNCGIEMGVASTKSFTSQCLVLLLCAIWISNFKKVKIDHSKTINSIRNLSSNISKILSNYDEIADLSYLINDSSKLFLLSGGISKAVADEGSLKIKEISYLNCQSYQVSSLKHGPFALIDSDTILIYIASYDDSEIYRKSLISISETKTRGSINIFITDKIPENSDSIDHLIIIPTSCLLTFPILSVIPLQILAYKLSINRNINPDFPRNLAKSVTVE